MTELQEVIYKLRITYGKIKPDINNLKITHAILNSKVYVADYIAGLEKGKKGQYHTQGLLTLKKKETKENLKLGKLVYKSGGRLEANRDLRKEIKRILKVKGSGNAFIALTPLKEEDTYDGPYCCKENIRIVGDPELFKEYNKLWNNKTLEKNNNRRCKYREEKDIKERIKNKYIENYRKKQKEDLSQNHLSKYFDVSGQLIIGELPFDEKVALSSILDIFTVSPKYTLRKTNAETYYQICLRLHKNAYRNHMHERLKNWIQ